MDAGLNVAETRVLIKALAFAAHKHRDQRRKDELASPYINHPIALAEILVEVGGISDVEVLCAAILHDTVEDTDTSAEELGREFGAAIRDMVMEVTDDTTLRKAERKLAQVENAGTASHGARLVKLADKISNLRDICTSPPRGWPLERQQEYFDWARSVVDRLRGTHAALEAEFDRVWARRPR